MNIRSRNVLPKMVPVHQHDCDACIYLGSRIAGDLTFDFYVCPSGTRGDTIIARHGIDGDYYSCNLKDLRRMPIDPNYPLTWAHQAYVAGSW